MPTKANSLSHTKWILKYYIVFTPKYRRKIIYNQYRKDLSEILKQLCGYKGVELIEEHMMPDHVHILVSIPPKISISSFMGYLIGAEFRPEYYTAKLYVVGNINNGWSSDRTRMFVKENRYGAKKIRSSGKMKN